MIPPRHPGPEFASPPAEVAVVRLSAIGDTVHAVPVIESLRAAWPGTRITWVIQPGPLGLMRGRPDVDEFLVFERSLGARAYAKLWKQARGRRFDLVINLHPNFKGGMVTGLLPAPIRIGLDRSRTRDLSWLASTHRVPPRPTAHVQDEFFELLGGVGVPARPAWDFHFTPDEERAAARFFDARQRPVLALVACSSDARKDWPIERYAALADQAVALGFDLILAGGVSAREEEAAAALSRLSRRATARIEDCRAHDLRRLAWLLRGSALVLAPDTGPLHLAVALGTPTVGLYGYTDPGRFGPYRRFHDLLIDRYPHEPGAGPSRVRRPGHVERITVDDVVEKIEYARRTYLD